MKSVLKRTFSHIKFIISGDFGQLPPVNDNWTGDYENSPALHILYDGNRISLTKCRRAENKLFELCKNVEKLDFSKYEYKEFGLKEKTYLNLALTHKTRRRVNDECMKRYLSEHKGIKTVAITMNKFNPKTQDVVLAKGMPIIAHKTVSSKENEARILNLQLFVITKVTDEYVIFKDEGEEVKIKTNQFHKTFYLGFCITIHASQGETFIDKYSIYDWGHPRFCNKAKYVALSRGTCVENIQIVC